MKLWVLKTRKTSGFHICEGNLVMYFFLEVEADDSGSIIVGAAAAKTDGSLRVFLRAAATNNTGQMREIIHSFSR